MLDHECKQLVHAESDGKRFTNVTHCYSSKSCIQENPQLYPSVITKYDKHSDEVKIDWRERERGNKECG